MIEASNNWSLVSCSAHSDSRSYPAKLKSTEQIPAAKAVDIRIVMTTGKVGLSRSGDAHALQSKKDHVLQSAAHSQR